MFRRCLFFRSLPPAFLVLFLLPPLADAEFSLSGYLGASITQDNDVKAKDNTVGLFTPLNITLASPSFDTSLTGGGKLGYWFGFFPNLGIEADVYHFSPDIGQQTRNISGTVAGTLVIPLGTMVTLGTLNPAIGVNVDRFDIGVTSLGFHLVGRLRLLQDNNFPNGRLQPYAGAGPAIFFADMRIRPFLNQSDSDTSVGVHALAGLKFFLHKNLSVFAEYKFSHFSPEFSFSAPTFGITARTTKVSTDIDSHHVYGGLAVHFDLF